MSIREITSEVNKKSTNYKIGNLQSIRKNLKGLTKKPSSDIFTKKTINEEEGWAFHNGGRSELQFNIGYEDEGLRYGIAFSLEPSQSLPDVSLLYPKIFKLNSIIREKPQLFADYNLWYHRNGRSKIMSVHEIGKELVKPDTFIFIGKLTSIENINYDIVLEAFDELLDIYIEVESESKMHNLKEIYSQYFMFDNKNKKLPQRTHYTSVEKVVNLEVRHSILQNKLYTELKKKYGKDNVGIENKVFGNSVDIVVKDKNEFIFYEVKTATSARSCIRQALGQLLDYAYWGGEKDVKKIVVAGEHEPNNFDINYLNVLTNKFNLPIEYEVIK